MDTQQAVDILDKYINILDEHFLSKNLEFEETLEEAEVFLLQWDIKEKKLLIYEVAGDYYNLIGDFTRSVYYYIEALECLDKTQFSTRLLDLTLKLSMMYVKLKRYEDGITNMDYLMNYEKDIPKGKLMTLIFNRALCYKNLKEYEKVLEELDKIEKLLEGADINKVFDILTLRANCYLRLGRFDEALSVYNNILDIIGEENIEKYIITVLNKAKLYCDINRDAEVIQCLERVLPYLDNISSSNSYITRIYLEIASAYKYLKKYDCADEYYSKGYSFTKLPSQEPYQMEVLTGMLDAAIESDNWERIEDIDNEVKYFLGLNRIKKDSRIIYKLIKTYNGKDKKHKVDDLVTYILNDE